jgi:Protein of unknown function (DUF1360)
MTDHVLPSPFDYDRPEAPFSSYAAMMGTFGAFAVAGVGAVARRNGGARAMTASALALLGVATFKLSRLITRDRITSVLRAPFVSFQEDFTHGEVEEKPRGTGVRLAVGELLVCPYCVSLWIGSGFAIAAQLLPTATRAVAGTLAVATLADVAQLGYRALEDKL